MASNIMASNIMTSNSMGSNIMASNIMGSARGRARADRYRQHCEGRGLGSGQHPDAGSPAAMVFM